MMSESQITEAVGRIQAGESYRKVAAYYGVCIATIQHHVRRGAAVVRTMKTPIRISTPAPKKATPPLPAAHKAKKQKKEEPRPYETPAYFPRTAAGIIDWQTWTQDQIDSMIPAAQADGFNPMTIQQETGFPFHRSEREFIKRKFPVPVHMGMCTEAKDFMDAYKPGAGEPTVPAMKLTPESQAILDETTIKEEGVA